MANHLADNKAARAAWEARKRELEQAYVEMKEEMVRIVNGTVDIPTSRIAVDRICDLYSAYCERWETY